MGVGNLCYIPTYYIKEVQGSMLYITLILMYVMEEVWEYWMEIDIMILYSNTP